MGWSKNNDEDLDCRAAPADLRRTYETLPNRWHPSDHLHLGFLRLRGMRCAWPLYGFVFVLGTSKQMWLGWSQSRALLTWYHHHVPGGGKLITPKCIQGVKQPRSEGILKLCVLQLCCGNRYVSFGPDCPVPTMGVQSAILIHISAHMFGGYCLKHRRHIYTSLWIYKSSMLYHR